MQQPKETYSKSSSELREELHNNILSLDLLCQQYDKGHYFLAPLIAVVLRTILFSKGAKNSSLLENNKFESMSFVSSIADRYIPNSKVLLSPYMPLMQMHVKEGVGSYESRDKGQRLLHVMLLPFDIWWHQIALDDRKGGCYSRRDIILTIADKFGAHSDLKIEKGFADISFHNSLGFQYEKNGDVYDFKGNPSYISLRQIAQETIASYCFLGDFKLERICGTEFMSSTLLKRGTGYDHKCYIRLKKISPSNFIEEKLFEDTYKPIVEQIKVSRNEYLDSDGNILRILMIYR